MELTRITFVLVSQVLYTVTLALGPPPPPPGIDDPFDISEPVTWEPVTSQGGCAINCTLRGNLPCVVERITLTNKNGCPPELTNSGIDFPPKPTSFRTVLNFKEANGKMEPYLDMLWKPPANTLTTLKGYQMSLTRIYGTIFESECVRFNMTNAVWTDDDFDNRQQLQHKYSCYGPLKENKSRSYELQVDLFSLPQPRLNAHTQEYIITWLLFVPPPVSVEDFNSTSAYLWKASPLVMFSNAKLELNVTFDVAPAHLNIQKYTITVHDYITSNTIRTIDVNGHGKQTVQRSFPNLCNGTYYVTVEPKAWDGDTCLCPNNDGGCGCSVARAPYHRLQKIIVENFIPDRICNGPISTSTTTKRSVSSASSKPSPTMSVLLETSVSTPSSTLYNSNATSLPGDMADTSTGKETPRLEALEEQSELGDGSIAGIFMGVCLGVGAALVVLFFLVRRRLAGKKVPVIVVLGSRDNPHHVQLVTKLAIFIGRTFRCRVVCNLQEEIADSVLNKAHYIIVITSEGVLRRCNASKEGKEYKLVETRKPISDSLIPALQFLKRNLISYEKFAEKVVKVKFPYSNDQCLRYESDGALKLTLMDEFEQFCSLIPAKPREQNGDDPEINESYSNFINALQNAGEFHRKDPAWFTEKFYITREGVDIAIEDIAPGFVDLDIGAGGIRSDVMSIVSGNTECVTVCQMDV